jgi:hypothetical protein
MPVVHGSMKVKQMTLQGTVVDKDFNLEINNDNFEIRRGNKTLMTLGDEDNDNEINNNDSGVVRNEITLSVPVNFEDDVNIKGNLRVEEPIPDAVLARKNTRVSLSCGADAKRYPALQRFERYKDEQQNSTEHTVSGFVFERSGLNYVSSCAHGLVTSYVTERKSDMCFKSVKDLTITNVYDRNLCEGDIKGFFNDCWGHEFIESVYPDGWSLDDDGWTFGPGLSKKQYALVGDSEGMSVNEVDVRNQQITELIRYNNTSIAVWTDMKTYCVHTLTMNGDLSHVKKGDFLTWKFSNHRYVYVLEVLTVNNSSNELRGKTVWPILKDCIDVQCSSHPDISIASGKREEFCYWGKDGGSLHVMDLANLRDKSNRRVDEVKVYYENKLALWPENETTGDPNVYPFYAGHNLQMDETTGTLFNLLDFNGNTLLDVKNDPASPKVVGKMSPLHDCKTVSYSRSEQNEILGIPLGKCKEELTLTVGADGKVYTIDLRDRINPVVLGSCNLPGYDVGYVHGGDMTSDKRFFITHLENSGDSKTEYYGAAFVCKLKYDSVTEVVVPVWVQTFRNDVPGHGHNSYITSNIPYHKRKTEFEDYAFHANYNAGGRIFRLRYKSYYDKNDVQNTEPPFDVKEVAFVEPDPSLGHGDLGGTWNIFPFNLGTDTSATAAQSDYSDGTCLTSGMNGFQVFNILNESSSFYGKEYSDLKDNNTDGQLTLLSKGPSNTTARPLKFIARTKNNKLINQSELYNVNMADNRLDIAHTLLSKVTIDDGDELIKITQDDLGTVEKGEMVYVETARGFFSGKVVNASETVASNIADDTGFGYQVQPPVRTHFNRIDEIITTLPCVQGDSGCPVFNKHGKLVGAVRDSDGQYVGVTKINKEFITNENNMIGSDGIKKTNIKSFKGVWNEMMAGRSTDDPYSFWAPYIHEGSGKIQGYLSGSGTNYNLLGFYPADKYLDKSLPDEGLPLGMLPNEKGFNEILTGASLTDGNKFVVGTNVYSTWMWNFSGYPNFVTYGPFAVPLTSPNLTLGEYIKGTQTSDGPKLFVMDKYRTSENGSQETYVVDGVTHYLYVCLPVSKFSDPDIDENLYAPPSDKSDWGGSRTMHLPVSGDVMTSDSGVQVTCGFTEDGSSWDYSIGQQKCPISFDFANAENPWLTERYTKMFYPEFVNSRVIGNKDVSTLTAFLPHYNQVDGGMTVRGKGDVDTIEKYDELSADNTLNLLFAGEPFPLLGSYLGIELLSVDGSFENMIVQSQDPRTINSDESNKLPTGKVLSKINGSPITPKTIKDIYLSPRNVEMTLELEDDATVYRLMTRPYVARTIKYV